MAFYIFFIFLPFVLLPINGELQSNRMMLANMMLVFSMFSQNQKQKNTAKSFTIGKDYKVNANILEGGIFQRSDDEYRATFFLQQQKDIQQNVRIIPKEGDPDAKQTITANLDEGAQFHPLDMVYLTDVSGETEISYFVPAIYLKALADAQEWQVVMENIRIAADIIAVVIGLATLPTGNPYFLLLAIADISLAGADLTIQAFKEEILKYEGGEEFYNTWEKIYIAGGFSVAGLTLVGGFYIAAARLLTKITEGAAKNYLKTLILKAILETNISNFQKNTLKVLEPQEIFLGAEYKAMGNEMAGNGVIFLSGQKEGKFAKSYAAMYKGEVIEEFTKAELKNVYKKWGNLTEAKMLEKLDQAAVMAKPANIDDYLGGKILKTSQLRKYRGELKQRRTALILEEDTKLNKFGKIANRDVIKNYKPVILSGIKFDSLQDLFYFMRKRGFAGLFDHHSKQLILTENPTEYLMFHEMAHLKQFEEIGNAYLLLKPWQRETYVFEEIWKQKHLWTKKEAQHALDYVNSERKKAGQPLIIKKL